jgi:hypothetical protein
MLNERRENLDADCKSETSKSETSKSYSNKSEYDDRSISNLTNIDYINLAALFNYHDDKCKEHFSDIYLPTITVSYTSLTQLFFDRREKIFTTYCLDTIWDSIQGLKLSNIFLKKYEKKHIIHRNYISPILKIKLYKECTFSKITTKAYRVIALNFQEFNYAINSIYKPTLSHIHTCISFYLFSEALEIGIKIILPIKISELNHIAISDSSSDSEQHSEQHSDSEHHSDCEPHSDSDHHSDCEPPTHSHLSNHNHLLNHNHPQTHNHLPTHNHPQTHNHLRNHNYSTRHPTHTSTSCSDTSSEKNIEDDESTIFFNFNTNAR